MSALPQPFEPESYEDCVSAAITEREKKDASQWRIGDLATRALGKTVSGRSSGLSEFAREVGLGASVMSDYKAMSEFYPPMHRNRAPNLSHTHYRTAWRNNRNDFASALRWLDTAADAGWSCDKMAVEMHSKPQVVTMMLSDLLAKVGDCEVSVKELETVLRCDIEKPA